MNIPVRVGETIEGSRTMRNRPYPVLKCSSKVKNSQARTGHRRGPHAPRFEISGTVSRGFVVFVEQSAHKRTEPEWR